MGSTPVTFAFWFTTAIFCSSMLHFGLASREKIGSIASRHLLQGTCPGIPSNLMTKAQDSATSPLYTLKMQYPVYAKGRHLGEFGDGCTYAIPFAEWQKQMDPPENYMESLRRLADIAVSNDANNADCRNNRAAALSQWKKVVLAWKNKKGFLSPSSSVTGQYYTERALCATAASFAKVRPLFAGDMATINAVLGYIKDMDAYAAVIKGSKNNHEIWKRTSRLLASVVFGEAAKAEQHAEAIIKLLSEQVRNGVVTVEKRCTRTFFYQTSYLEGAMISLATLKAYTKNVPNSFKGAVSSEVNKMITSLEGPNPAQFLATAFGYSKAVVDKMETSVATKSVKRLRGLYNFITGSKTKVPVSAGDCVYVGYLHNLPF